MHMKSQFYKPEFKAFSGKAPRSNRCYAYPAAMVVEYDIFDLLPLDGGAFFFLNQHLGGKSTATFTGGYMSGRLFGPWAGNRKAPPASMLNWFAAYDPEKGPWAPGQKTEQHVWLHRLYFLLPFAQEYLRTGDRTWARRWFEYFAEFRTRFPAMGDPLAPKAKHTAYIWHDMQPTWRLLVMIHSVFMLGQQGKAAPFSAREWSEIYKAIDVHARWVHEQAADGLTKKSTGNHFLQKGTALVIAGTLFPELENAATWVKTGRSVLRDQMEREINTDGGSIEASPSYSHFIARLYLEAWLILKANRQTEIPGLKDVIARQYGFLEDIMTPAGRTLQVGDSYALDARLDLSIVRRLFNLKPAVTGGNVFHKASRMAVIRSLNTVAYVDAMDVACGHIHTPKPNLLVYHRGKPVLIDSGCVNYDLPEYGSTHFRTWPAHNVVAPEEFVKTPAVRRVVNLELLSSTNGPDGGEVVVLCRYAGDDISFDWKRRVRLAGDAVEIVDDIDASAGGKFTMFLHLAEKSNPGVRVEGAGVSLHAVTGRQAAVDENNRRFMARTLAFSQTGKRLTFRTLVAL